MPGVLAGPGACWLNLVCRVCLQARQAKWAAVLQFRTSSDKCSRSFAPAGITHASNFRMRANPLHFLQRRLSSAAPGRIYRIEERPEIRPRSVFEAAI